MKKTSENSVNILNRIRYSISENITIAIIGTGLAIFSSCGTNQDLSDSKGDVRDFIEANANNTKLENKLSVIADEYSDEDNTQVACEGISRFPINNLTEGQRQVGAFVSRAEFDGESDLIVLSDSLCEAVVGSEKYDFNDLEQALFTFAHEIGHQKGYEDELDADCYAAQVYGSIVLEFISSQTVYEPQPEEILAAPRRLNEFSEC